MKIKSEYMQCGRCAGNGKVENPKSKDYDGGGETMSIEAFDNIEYMEWQKNLFIDCPNCDGTGELVCISRKQFEVFLDKLKKDDL